MRNHGFFGLGGKLRSSNEILRSREVGTGDAIVRVIMKNTFFAILAVFAAASFTQASEVQTGTLPEFKVSAQAFRFIDDRLEAVVAEETAKSLSQPIPASTIAALSVKQQPRVRFALAKDASDIVLLTTNNS
jgi:hypothetical protein